MTDLRLMLLGFIALTACGEEARYRLEPGDVIDLSAFPAEFRPDARRAVHEWNTSIAGLGLTTNDEWGSWHVRDANIESELGVTHDGAFNWSAPVVYVDLADLAAKDRLSWVGVVVAHELGHSLGIYTEADSGLMRGGTFRPLCIDPVTVELLAHYRPDLTAKATCPVAEE